MKMLTTSQYALLLRKRYYDKGENLPSIEGLIFDFATLMLSKPEKWMFLTCDKHGDLYEHIDNDISDMISRKGSRVFDDDMIDLNKEYIASKKKVIFQNFNPDLLDFYLSHKTVEGIPGIEKFEFTRSAKERFCL